MDIGECPKIHDYVLIADFEKAQQKFDHYYDVDATEHLQAFMSDYDRRTKVVQKRLLETQEELTAVVAEKANAVHELAEQIGQTLAKAEELGAQGLVDDSLKLMGKIEDLRTKKSEALETYKNSIPKSSYQQQKLMLCDICSAYLSIHDHDKRLTEHFGGKLHLGFIKIRGKLSELEKNYEERHEAWRKFDEHERYKRDDKRSHQSRNGNRKECHRRSRNHRGLSETLHSRLDSHQTALAKRARPPIGHKIIISNLEPSVTCEDIRELFADIGDLLESKVIRPGVAEVIYNRRADAIQALDVYHNRQLDGRTMKCDMVRNAGSKSGPITVSGPSRRMPARGADLYKPSAYVGYDLDAVHTALFNNK